MKINWQDHEIRELIEEGDIHSYKGRFERLKFLLSIESQKSFPVSALVHEYYEEARLCWYVGAFTATIVMVQISFEELFRSHYRVAKGVGGALNCSKPVDNATFHDLILEARNDRWISEEEAKSLDDFRKNIRNPYVHLKDIKSDQCGRPDLKKSNFLTQLLKIEASELMESDVEQEAKYAIQLLVTMLPEISSRYGGL
jgi:hypothetical protein